MRERWPTSPLYDILLDTTFRTNHTGQELPLDEKEAHQERSEDFPQIRREICNILGLKEPELFFPMDLLLDLLTVEMVLVSNSSTIYFPFPDVFKFLRSEWRVQNSKG